MSRIRKEVLSHRYFASPISHTADEEGMDLGKKKKVPYFVTWEGIKGKH